MRAQPQKTERTPLHLHLDIREKNIISVRNKFIDLNFITDITLGRDSIFLQRINGEPIKIDKPSHYNSYEDVPSKYTGKRYKRDEADAILENLNLSFGKTMGERWDSSYNSFKIYNKIATEREKTRILAEWDKTCVYLLNKWSNIRETTDIDLTMNIELEHLMKVFYESNKNDKFIYEKIYKVFGLNFSTIARIIGRDDYFVNQSGRVELK